MARQENYDWGATDTLWRVAGRFLARSGYPDTLTLATGIRAANPAILDWRVGSPQLAAGATPVSVVIPFLK